MLLVEWNGRGTFSNEFFTISPVSEGQYQVQFWTHPHSLNDPMTGTLQQCKDHVFDTFPTSNIRGQCDL